MNDTRTVTRQVLEQRRNERAIIPTGDVPLSCCHKVGPLVLDTKDERAGYYKCLCGQRYFVDHRRRTWRML